MKKIKKDNYRYISYILAGALLLLFLLVIQIHLSRRYSDKKEEENLYILEEVTIRTPSFEYSKVNLPSRLHTNKTGEYILIANIPMDVELKDPVIQLRTKNCDYRMYLGNQELYAFSKASHLRAGDRVDIVSLPKSLSGQQLRIVIRQNIRNSSHIELDNIILGERYTTYGNLLKGNLPEIIILLIIMIFGTFILIMALVFRGIESLKRLKYIGIFSIIFSMYVLSTMDFVLAVTRNAYLVYIVEYSCFFFLPLFVIKLFISEVELKFVKIFSLILKVIYLNIFLQIMSYSFEIAEFPEMVFFTRCIDIIVIGIGIYAIIASKNREVLKRLIPILIGAISYFLLYFVTTTFPKTVIFIFGVLLYIMIEIVELLRKVVKFKVELHQTGIYQRLAYMDSLTGVYNRNALMEDIAIYNRVKDTKLWCVFIDINKLKQTNDTKGHSYGDDIIRQIAGLLQNEFDRCGKVYRMGGDEFIVLILNVTGCFIEEKIKHLNYQKKQVNRKSGCDLSYAIGYDYQQPEEKVEDLISRVDNLMYLNKKNRMQEENETENETENDMTK